DFYLAQVTDKPPRDERVDFSVPYYQANQAIVVKKDSQYAHATSLADLKGATLGAEVSTTSYQAIQEVIQPDNEAKVYNTTKQATQALQNGQIDGLVVDFPTAYYIAYVEPGGLAIAGQFTGSGGEEQWGARGAGAEVALRPGRRPDPAVAGRSSRIFGSGAGRNVAIALASTIVVFTVLVLAIVNSP